MQVGDKVLYDGDSIVYESVLIKQGMSVSSYMIEINHQVMETINVVFFPKSLKKVLRVRFEVLDMFVMYEEVIVKELEIFKLDSLREEVLE